MSKGYGYGLWLIPDSDNKLGESIISKYNTLPHCRHVTIICNCSKEDAEKAYEMLSEKYLFNKIFIRNQIHKFSNGPYSTTDTITSEAAGWDVDVTNWEKIVSTLKKLNIEGDMPLQPHMSLLYRNSLSDQIVDYVRSTENDEENIYKYFNANINLVDIRMEEPWKWKVLKSLIYT